MEQVTTGSIRFMICGGGHTTQATGSVRVFSSLQVVQESYEK